MTESALMIMLVTIRAGGVVSRVYGRGEKRGEGEKRERKSDGPFMSAAVVGFREAMEDMTREATERITEA